MPIFGQTSKAEATARGVSRNDIRAIEPHEITDAHEISDADRAAQDTEDAYLSAHIALMAAIRAGHGVEEAHAAVMVAFRAARLAAYTAQDEVIV